MILDIQKLINENENKLQFKSKSIKCGDDFTLYINKYKRSYIKITNSQNYKLIKFIKDNLGHRHCKDVDEFHNGELRKELRLLTDIHTWGYLRKSIKINNLKYEVRKLINTNILNNFINNEFEFCINMHDHRWAIQAYHITITSKFKIIYGNRDQGMNTYYRTYINNEDINKLFEVMNFNMIEDKIFKLYEEIILLAI